jgi:hypothetical protein
MQITVPLFPYFHPPFFYPFSVGALIVYAVMCVIMFVAIRWFLEN